MIEGINVSFVVGIFVGCYVLAWRCESAGPARWRLAFNTSCLTGIGVCIGALAAEALFG